MLRKPSIALALGGGGAKGLAHIGVIKAFESAGIRPDLIVGSSAGALVGAAYASQCDIAGTLDRVQEVFGSGHTDIGGFRKFTRFHFSGGAKGHFLNRMLRSWAKEILVGYAMFRKAVLSEKDLRECTAAFVPDIDIEDTRIPLALIAVDLLSGNIVTLKKGSLVQAVMASCAVPGFMPPIRMDGMMLVDGSVLSGIPAAVARSEGGGIVIGVDVGACLCRPPVLDDGIDIINRSAEIMNFHLTRLSGRQADKRFQSVSNLLRSIDRAIADGRISNNVQRSIVETFIGYFVMEDKQRQLRFCDRHGFEPPSFLVISPTKKM